MGVSRISIREAAAVLVAVALVSVAHQAWETVRSGYQTFTNRAPTLSERELGPVPDAGLGAALNASRSVIPRDATFSVRVGQSPPIDSSILDAVTPLFRYWLLPRRYNIDDRAVDWVITFHHDAETLGVPIRRVVPLGNGTDAVEVAR